MQKPPPIVVNGRFLSRPVTGVERYARALVNALPFEHRVARTPGFLPGHAWEQFMLPFRMGRGQFLISPANTGPLAVPRQVLVLHDLAFWHHPELFAPTLAKWYRWLIPRLARRAAHVVAPSEESRKDIMSTFGLQAERVTVVPPYVGTDTFASEVDPGIGSPYYLVVGSLDPRKGLDRALAWYTSIYKPQFKLVIVGRDHRAFRSIAIPRIEGVLHLSDVDDRNLAGLYRGAIALIQPSLFEGFGLPILEAMTLGCPVIASDLKVFRECFGDAPCYAEIGGTRSMMEAMLEMENSDRRAERIGRGKAAAARFSRARTAAALRAVIDPLLA